MISRVTGSLIYWWSTSEHFITETKTLLKLLKTTDGCLLVADGTCIIYKHFRIVYFLQFPEKAGHKESYFH